MNAEYENLAVLLDIQRIDLEIMQAKKKRAELPQRIKITMLRKKRAEVEAKLEKVKELQEEAQTAMAALEQEDAQLAEKQQRAQELIDVAGSDFRKVESHSKEMAGSAKRRDTLAEQMLAKTAELDKIVSVRTQIENAIEASNAEEAKVRVSFEEEDSQLVGLVKDLMDKRAKLIGSIPADLAALYEKTAARTGGVAIGKLGEDGTCGICRSVIDGGRLIELRASAPLGTCPSCKRLLVIE